MGFFSNGTFSSGGQFESAAAGAYAARLVSVEEVERPSYDDPSINTPNYKFTWETTEFGDTQGVPFKFFKYTRTSYGNDRAGLTILLDSMLGRRLTSQEFGELDLSDLLSPQWMVTVDSKVNAKGNLTNAVISVHPVTTKKKLMAKTPPKQVSTDGISDPFED